MYADTATMMKLNGRVSRGFSVKVGVHQGSVLSPLLFIIVMEALSKNFRGLSMELLYADDLVSMADSEDELVQKIRKWKASIEEKSLRVNMGKTKVMRCHADARQVVKSGKFLVEFVTRELAQTLSGVHHAINGFIRGAVELRAIWRMWIITAVESAWQVEVLQHLKNCGKWCWEKAKNLNVLKSSATWVIRLGWEVELRKQPGQG